MPATVASQIVHEVQLRLGRPERLMLRHVPSRVIGVQKVLGFLGKRLAEVVLVAREDIRVLVAEAHLGALVERAQDAGALAGQLAAVVDRLRQIGRRLRRSRQGRP